MQIKKTTANKILKALASCGMTAYWFCGCCTTVLIKLSKKGWEKMRDYLSWSMQGKKRYQEKLFTRFQLSDRFPEENFYRRLQQGLSLDFLYEQTKCYYGDCGQKSIDPVVFFKLCLVGYLENIISDRQLIQHCSMRLDILFFSGTRYWWAFALAQHGKPHPSIVSRIGIRSSVRQGLRTMCGSRFGERSHTGSWLSPCESECLHGQFRAESTSGDTGSAPS